MFASSGGLHAAPEGGRLLVGPRSRALVSSGWRHQRPGSRQQLTQLRLHNQPQNQQHSNKRSCTKTELAAPQLVDKEACNVYSWPPEGAPTSGTFTFTRTRSHKDLKQHHVETSGTETEETELETGEGGLQCCGWTDRGTDDGHEDTTSQDSPPVVVAGGHVTPTHSHTFAASYQRLEEEEKVD